MTIAPTCSPARSRTRRGAGSASPWPKIRSSSGIAEPLGVDALINPRATTVSSILRHVRRGKVRAVYSVGGGEAEVIEAQVMATSPIAGKRIRDIGFPAGSIVGAVLTSDGVRMPKGDLVVKVGDVMVVFAVRDSVRQLEQMFRVSMDFF